MFDDLVTYLTRDVRPFMDLLSNKGQLVETYAMNDNATNDNFEDKSILPPEAAA